MPLKEVIAAIVLLVVSLVYGYLGMQLPERAVPNVPGPAFFPGLVALILVMLSLALLVKGLSGMKREPGSMAVLLPGWRPVIMLLWCFGFVAVLPWAGFLLAAIPFFAGLMLMCDQRRWWVVAVGAIAIPAILFYLFRYGVNILLPLPYWS